MSEYATRESTYSSSTTTTRGVEGMQVATPADLAADAISGLVHATESASRAVASIEAAAAKNEPRQWHQARETASRDIATAERMLKRALARQTDAPPASLPQLALAETSLGAAKAQLATMTEAPKAWRALPEEARVIEVLAKPIVGPSGPAWQAKESELKAVLRDMNPADSRLLADRLRKLHAGDPIVEAFSHMVPERRGRILAFLDDARRRQAVRETASPAIVEMPAPTSVEAPAQLKRTKFGDFVRKNVADLRIAIDAHLSSVPWPSPAPDIDFLDGGERRFVFGLKTFFLPHLETGEELPELLHPSDILAELAQITSGGTVWNRSFGLAMAQAVEASAKASLFRLGPRYRSALIRRGHRPDADDLLASHPMDPIVAAAMVARDVLPDAPPEGATAETPAPSQSHVETRWLGHAHPELWNFVEVKPATATVEDVAISLWRDPAKSTMAFAIRKYGELFRIAPTYARKLLAERYRGEVVGATDVDNATQVAALARSSLRGGDAAARELPPINHVATNVQIAEIEERIGERLEGIRLAVAPFHLEGELLPALGARLVRLGLLPGADDATRKHWLPVLLFQHTQLIAISEQVGSLARKLGSLDASAKDERARVTDLLHLYVQAAAVSHLRDESTAIMQTIAAGAHRDLRRATDSTQRQLDADTRQDSATPKHDMLGAEQALERAQSLRESVLNGPTARLSSREQKESFVFVGEVSLRSRMHATEHSLAQVYELSTTVFGTPEEFRKVFPDLKPYPEFIADVRAHLADVQQVWDEATAKAGADNLDAREAGLAAARERFAKIAGDRSVAEFIQTSIEKIRHQLLVSKLVMLAGNLVLMVVVSMAASTLAPLVAGAVVGEAAVAAGTIAATTIEFVATVSINSAMQSLMSGESFGWALVQNSLMEMFTRGLSAPLRRVERAAQLEAREIAALPHLAASEREALLAADFGGAHLLNEVVGGMATQWAADRLVELVHHTDNAVSEPFAFTALQQGAAVGLGRFFHGRVDAWHNHVEALAHTRLGELPELKRLIAEGEAVFARDAELASSLSPDPAQAEQQALAHLELIEKTSALIAANPHLLEASTGARAAAPPDTVLPGSAIADAVGGVRYGDGEFVVASAAGEKRVAIQRTNGATRLRTVDAAHIVLEIPRGLTGIEVERAVAGKLAEVRETANRRARGEKASGPSGLGPHGTGEHLSAADMGKIAELRLLRERLAQGGEHEKLAHDVATLERELGIDGSAEDAAKRRRVVEAQIDVQADYGRRAAARAKLDGAQGHPGIDVHTHFMGVIDAEVFRKRAATAAGQEGSTSWKPLLERIAALEGAEFHHAMEGKTSGGRAVAADAVRLAREALGWYRATIDRSENRELPTAERQQLTGAAEKIAEDGCRSALGATQESDYNGAYEVRDALVKQTFGGPQAADETPAAKKQRAYDDMIRETLLELARQHLGYTEQSVSLNKLAGAISPARVQTILRELIHDGKIAEGAVDVRLLGMMPTAHFGERNTEAEPPAEKPPNLDFGRDVRAGADGVRHPGTVGNDVAGPELWTFDAAGIERFRQVYRSMLHEAKASGMPMVFRPHVGEGVVDTEHGEAFHTDKNRRIGPNGEPSHYARSEKNIDAMLEALEGIPELDTTKVIVRLGHVTHATPAQTERMRKLGVIAEVNLGSNVATGSLSQTVGPHGPRAQAEQFGDHALTSLIYYDVQTLISTDGGAVMGTNLAGEYARANLVIESVLTGKLSVRITVADAMRDGHPRGREVPNDPSQRELMYDELDATERDRFKHAYEKLYADAIGYYLARPRPGSAGAGSATVNSPMGGAHHLSLAEAHGLVPTQGTKVYEGVRTDIERAAAAYREADYRIDAVPLDGKRVAYSVESKDKNFRVLLRSWHGDGPAFKGIGEGPHDNTAVRRWYHEAIARIAALNEGWIAAGIPASERAHRAFGIRVQARKEARAHMQDMSEVTGLRDRDFAKYQDADGGSYEGLVAKYSDGTLTPDEVFEKVIVAAQRPDPEYDARAGLSEESK